MTLDELLTPTRQLGAHGQRLRDIKKRFQTVDEEAAADIQAAIEDPSASGRAYRLLGKAQHEADRRQIAATKRAMLKPRMDVAFYQAEHLHMQIEKAYREFIEESKAAPSIESAFLRLTNSAGVSKDQMLSLAILEQVTINNVRAELRTASPARRLELYKGASRTPFDPVSSVMIRMIEEMEGGYSSAGPPTEAELKAVSELGRLKEQARLARVPGELAEVEKVLAETAADIRSARNAGALPLNPQHRPELAKEIADAEAAELAMEAAQ